MFFCYTYTSFEQAHPTVLYIDIFFFLKRNIDVNGNLNVTHGIMNEIN